MKEAAVKLGIVAGFLTIGYYLALYFTNKEFIFNSYPSIGSILINLIFMYRAVQHFRKELNGKITFKQGLRPGFQVYIVSGLIFYVFLYCLFNFIDPSLTELWSDLGAEQGGSQNPEDYKFTLPTTLFTFFSSLIPGFIFSAIIAAIMKTA